MLLLYINFENEENQMNIDILYVKILIFILNMFLRTISKCIFVNQVNQTLHCTVYKHGYHKLCTLVGFC